MIPICAGPGRGRAKQVRRTRGRQHELASRWEGASQQGTQASRRQRSFTRTEVGRTLATPKYKLGLSNSRRLDSLSRNGVDRCIKGAHCPPRWLASGEATIKATGEDHVQVCVHDQGLRLLPAGSLNRANRRSEPTSQHVPDTGNYRGVDPRCRSLGIQYWCLLSLRREVRGAGLLPIFEALFADLWSMRVLHVAPISISTARCADWSAMLPTPSRGGWTASFMMAGGQDD